MFESNLRPAGVLLAALLFLAACQAPDGVDTSTRAAVDDEISTLAPPCAECLECPQSAGGPQTSVLRTRTHELRIDGGALASDQRVRFREISEGTQPLVGVHTSGVPASGVTLRLSFTGCAGALPADLDSLRIRRFATGGRWEEVLGEYTVSADSVIEVRINGNSKYAVATN